MNIVCPHCTLRPWRQTDLPSLVQHANNRRVASSLRDIFPHPYTEEDAKAWLTYATAQTETVDFAIEVEGQAASGIGYTRGSDVARFSAEIGYWLGEAFWNRGIATEAVCAFADHAFNELRLLRLYAPPFANNLGSIRVLERAGFVCEGLLHASVVKDGRVLDQWLYARVNPRWAPA